MTIASGSRLGPYEILSPLGSGGMGEVWRARDPRLGRDVALKILPPSFSRDADRVRRFEQEARSASGLNHPNIITIHEIGSEGTTLYIAMEVVEGGSLRELMAAGPLPTRKLLDVGVQIADGLAKAHAAGIVHRDLKPENVMVSRDGFVKILDFGLAKLAPAPKEQSATMATTMQQETHPGTVMGTVGYMSPEQASGRSVDFRSDQFSCGSMLYEMATGRRAFQRDTGAETLSAIIRDDPEPLGRLNPRAPAPFRWIVERCLAKDPEERYASTRDLARELKSIRDHISEASVSGEVGVTPAPKRRASAPLIALAALAAGLFGGFLLDRRLTRTEPPLFHQLTFQRGEIQSARFAPDGQTVLYTASWEGKPMEIFSRRLESPESRPSGLSGTELLAISPAGEMAVSLTRHTTETLIRSGRLATVSVAGGVAPRELLEDIQWADWSPDGKALAIVRDVAGRNSLEFPPGKALYQTAGYVTHPRVSPAGDAVAFIDHPARGDDGGAVFVVDRSGKRREIPGHYESAWGLAWAPDGKEVWFTATEAGNNRSLYAARPSGAARLLARVPGELTLEDVGRQGRALVVRESVRQGMMALPPGEEKERDLAWLDYSSLRDLSSDGRLLLFDETGEGGGPGYSVYIRKTDASPAARLGDGAAWALSPDGKWALAIVSAARDPQIVVYPTGVGEPRRLPADGLRVEGADWLPDGKAIVFNASEPGHGSRLYVRTLEGGKPRAFSPEGYRLIRHGVSPDGKVAVVTGPDGNYSLFPIDGGSPQPLPGVEAQERIEGWTAGGRNVLVHRRGELPTEVYNLDVRSGRRELWKSFMPVQTAGLGGVGGVLLARDGRSYAYGTSWRLADLYLVDGLK